VFRHGEISAEWHKSLLHDLVPTLIKKWDPQLNVRVPAYFLQRMKTKWGSCNHEAGHIRLNTQFVTKPNRRAPAPQMTPAVAPACADAH
jgi:predicted metal-dependent hydrolase